MLGQYIKWYSQLRLRAARRGAKLAALKNATSNGCKFYVVIRNEPKITCLPPGSKKINYTYVIYLCAKTKYMVMSRDQNAGWIHSVGIDNSTFETVEEFKYLGTTLTNQNSIAEEIKSRLRSGNACYHSVQNLLSSRSLSKNLKIKIYRAIILPVVLDGCETWSLILREERKLRVFENMVLRRIFGPRRDEVTGEWRRLHNEELNDLYCSPNIVRVIKSRRMRWARHVARMGEERGCIGSWWGNRREGDHWGDLGVDGWIMLGWMSRRWDVDIWTGLGCPRIETGGGRLWVR